MKRRSLPGLDLFYNASTSNQTEANDPLPAAESSVAESGVDRVPRGGSWKLVLDGVRDLINPRRMADITVCLYKQICRLSHSPLTYRCYSTTTALHHFTLSSHNPSHQSRHCKPKPGPAHTHPRHSEHLGTNMASLLIFAGVMIHDRIVHRRDTKHKKALESERKRKQLQAEAGRSRKRAAVVRNYESEDEKESDEPLPRYEDVVAEKGDGKSGGRGDGGGPSRQPGATR